MVVAEVDRTRRRLWALSAAALGLVAALGLALQSWGWSPLDVSSASLRAWAEERPWTHEPLLALEWALGKQAVTLATVVLSTWLLLRRQALAAVVVAGGMYAVLEVTRLAKAWFGMERPGWQETEALLRSGSFPSSHAATVTALAGMVVVLTFLGARRTAARVLVSGVATTAVLAVCADRLLLGRHYPSDVLGGVLLGGAVAIAALAVLMPATAGRAQGRHPVGDAPVVEERELVVSRPA